MLELFLPWFLMTCISGILGNRADAGFVSITHNIIEQVQVGKIVNHDMQKALNRSFFLAHINICDCCLSELKQEVYQQKGNFKLSGQFRWLETKRMSLENELKAVENAEYKEPTIEVLDEIKFLLIQGDSKSEAFQKIKTELIERAEIGDDKAPECYKRSVEENILSQMCNYFANEIKTNQALSNILETQLLVQLDIKIDALLASVPSMFQNLSLIPVMDQKLDYVYNVAQAMPQMLENIRSEKNSDAAYRIPFQVPPLTEDFVETPNKEEIKTYLLNNNSRGILAITAIQGLGGIGKTTLASLLCHDRDIENHFSEGILWVTLGQEPDKLSLLNSWIQELGDFQSNHTRVETASNHLRTLLHEKNILLVVDDAWNSGDVRPFLVGGPNCQTIITTRKNYITDDIGAKSYPLNLMTEEQSLELFRNILKDCWDENEKEEALKVAKDVGYLPLALNLAAKRRKKGYSWVKLHKALEEEIARLDILESPRIFGKGEEGLEASLNLSLRALRSYNEEVWKNFIWLGVLPEDVNISEKMASTLWDTDTKEAGEILEGLWGEGLLIQGSTIHFENEKLETYRMHDLFHDISRHYLTLSPITKKATDIPGLGLKLNEAHTSLLDHYQSQTRKELWHTIEDDAYIHSHLTWHMEKAGRIEDIHKLLAEENEKGKNGWYEALESLGLNAVFIEDVIRAWSISEKESQYQIEKGNKSSSIGLEIRYALIYTSINSLSANIPEELLVAFLETKKWTEDKVLIYAQKDPKLQNRAFKFISIYQKIKDESQKKEKLMENAFDAAFKLEIDTEMAEVLLAIFQYSDGQRKEELMKKALDATSKIKDNNDRAWALSKMINSVIFYNLDEQRKEDLMEKALNAIIKLEDNYARAKALSDVIPYLDKQRKEKMLEKAIDATSRIEDNDARLLILLSVIPYLDEQRKEEAMEKALDVASKIKEDYKRTKALLDIFPSLNGQRKEEVIEKALCTAFIIEADYKRVEVLLAIIPYLDIQRKEEMVEKALDIALNIKDSSDKAEAFSTILPFLGRQRKKEIVEKALDAASKIKNCYFKSSALLTIVPSLNGQNKEEVLEKAIHAASKIKDDNYRELALLPIIPYLDGQRKQKVLEQALEADSKIKYEGDNIRSLSKILPYLDEQKKEEMVEKDLEAASKMKYDDEIVWVLLDILPYLDGQRKQEAIEKTLDSVSKMMFNDERARALHITLSYLRNLPTNNIYFWWKKAIKVLRERTRSSLLMDITALIPVIGDLGNDETLFEVSQAITDVSRWWP